MQPDVAGEASGFPFVVEDMTDVDAFTALERLNLPTSPVYVATGLDRGDQLGELEPERGAPGASGTGRSPLLLGEGIQ